MSTVPTLHELDEAQVRESTLFDSLARLVPEELQTAYYRVLAHTRTLSPDDEMLRILEAMGILALLTRHTPKDIADERERIQAMLDAHLQFSDEAQEKMLGYVHFIEGRLAELPSEIEAGLDPQQIAKILGESLRQHFVSSGVPETVAGLQATSTAMGNTQKQLIGALRDLTDRDGGVAARVESANRQIVHTIERRNRTLDELIHEFKTDLLRIWIPIVTGAAMLIGLFAGMEIQGCRDSEPTPVTQSSPMPPLIPFVTDSPQEPTGKAPNSPIQRPPSRRAEHIVK
jgi:predicted secreted protein